MESFSLCYQLPEPFTVTIESAAIAATLGESIQLSADNLGTVPIAQYSWFNNQEIDINCIDALCQTIEVQPTTGTKFEVIATNEAGCEASTDLFLPIIKNRKIYVPNVFSPNGDGQNDLLAAFGKDDLSLGHFSIYDRWGTNIYQTNKLTINNLSEGWDGTYRGEKLQSGVYLWSLEVTFSDGDTRIFTGTVTLIR